MSITPPTDLVMDVLKAADPQQLAEAQQKLGTISASTQAVRLNADGQGFTAEVASLNDVALPSKEQGLRHSLKSNDTPEAYRKFEAMVLRNFVQEMLPQDSETFFGKGTAGDIWKGMLAEQLANTIAEGGGIGIADRLLQGSNQIGSRNTDQHAEFEGRVNNIAAAIGTKNQMNILADLLPGADNQEQS